MHIQICDFGARGMQQYISFLTRSRCLAIAQITSESRYDKAAFEAVSYILVSECTFLKKCRVILYLRYCV
jgi:hypothetical protein